MPLISLIIPVYKTETWLLECLESVRNQLLEDWEAIIVNDASPDNSADIARTFCDQDTRFKLIDLKENVGLGGARNAGCAVAQGQYLYFLDSDDLLPQHILSSMYKEISALNADLLIGDFYHFDDYSDVRPPLDQIYRADKNFNKVFATLPKIFTWHDLKHDYDLIMPSILTTTCCGKLFRHQLWKDLDCKVPGNLRMAEDFIPVKKFIFNAQRITWFDLSMILYRQHASSATKKRSLKAYEILRAYDYATKELGEPLQNTELHGLFERFIVRAIRDHMYSFLSYTHWFHYYMKAASIIRQLDLTNEEYKVDDIDLIGWSHQSLKTFIHLVWIYFKKRLRDCRS